MFLPCPRYHKKTCRQQTISQLVLLDLRQAYRDIDRLVKVSRKLCAWTIPSTGQRTTKKPAKAGRFK
jgi:hypothetical protein